MSRMRTLIGAATLAVLTTACASGASGDETAEVPEPTAAPTTVDAAPETTDTETPASAPTPYVEPAGDEVEDADDRLLIAAVIVATGSLDEALEAGVVTPAEVEAAIVAVQTGALGAAIES